ncbi:hypothetical protein GE118_00030 [Mycoplasma sp. NEAQ87857]|uniref:hypothetical protein n=1 Tax=Mycoplasma sp. NEAQ87857 TaxID=2683967 RepID=UPI0013185A20|nr:hypothetical protein [Mycoplasma sp. NEAQ87857]QGZ97190.1 hypothetical protein GE118_00030 [Mycoplasma sp. NEAQ87857]
MAQQVFVKCEKCNREDAFLFGKIAETNVYEHFLDVYEKKQINLFDKNKFIEVFSKEYADQAPKEDLEKALTKMYDEINEFFSEEEKKLIQKNILIGHDLWMHSVIKIDEIGNPDAKVYNIPVLKLKFLGQKEEYTRHYNNNVGYIQFDDDHQYLTCPTCGIKSSKYIKEETV